MGEAGARGIGDRWLAGEALPGVRFGWHDAVRVRDGVLAGRRARVLLLARVGDAVEYVIALDDGGGERRVAQDQLDAA